jgi:hypothetical protein
MGEEVYNRAMRDSKGIQPETSSVTPTNIGQSQQSGASLQTLSYSQCGLSKDDIDVESGENKPLFTSKSVVSTATPEPRIAADGDSCTGKIPLGWPESETRDSKAAK